MDCAAARLGLDTLEIRRRNLIAEFPYTSPIYRGAAWTTDAPFRETEAAIGQARARGILAVEMEAAALYAFAAARRKAVLCFAHVSNRMAVESDDFEKGDAHGSAAALAVIAAAARGWRRARQAAGPG